MQPTLNFAWLDTDPGDATLPPHRRIRDTNSLPAYLQSHLLGQCCNFRQPLISENGDLPGIDPARVNVAVCFRFCPRDRPRESGRQAFRSQPEKTIFLIIGGSRVPSISGTPKEGMLQYYEISCVHSSRLSHIAIDAHGLAHFPYN